jgi:hypothetical protein
MGEDCLFVWFGFDVRGMGIFDVHFLGILMIFLEGILWDFLGSYGGKLIREFSK